MIPSRRSNAVGWMIMTMTTITMLTFVTGQPDYTCDVFNDPCPYTFNNVCDSNYGTNPRNGCENADCADCDQCEQFHYDCNGCLNAIGCFWCPGDATCYNSPYYTFGEDVITSCTAVSDYDENGSCTKPENEFNDPLYDAQHWVYDMIHVEEVWKQGILGYGVRVRVNDMGVERDHDEFKNHYDESASCTGFDRPFPASEVPNVGARSHGTYVASIIAAEANNNVCMVGIAPEVSLSACNIFENEEINYEYAVLAYKVDQLDISQNSYGIPPCPIASRRHLSDDDKEEAEEEDNDGQHRRRRRRNLQSCPFEHIGSDAWPPNPCMVCGNSITHTDTLSDACETAITDHCASYFEEDKSACLDFINVLIGGICDYDQLTDVAPEALSTGILQGREGKGIIYVFSSGNSFHVGDDTNFSGFLNTRFTISVGSVGKTGYHSSFSTPGAALFITAPGGDHDGHSNHIVAIVSDAAGGSTSSCTDAGSGTSWASPVVSGVVALMLQANPDLTWRDVQGILAATSTVVDDDPHDDTKVTNAAGFTHSNLYGFGIVNAYAAVTTARDAWELWGTEQMLVVQSGIIDLPISDQSANQITTSTLTTSLVDSSSSAAGAASNADDFITESVVVLLDIRHFSRGDLNIILTSPSGTSSIINPGKRLETSQLLPDERWKLLTVRNWGESAIGEWTLSIEDQREGGVGDCADAPFTTNWFGTEVTCDFMDYGGLCVNDGPDPDTFDGRRFSGLLDRRYEGLTVLQACCVCGGGLTVNEFDNILKQWRLVVYGRHSTSTIITTETSNPTGVPSRTPTPEPTKEPTSRPTDKPTSRPTDKPTSRPTDKPTSRPTMMPTSRPTDKPTSGPTMMPTKNPTTVPTVQHSKLPTIVPTTSDPTSVPTRVLSDIPTTDPTSVPTKVLSDMPTTDPTSRPTTAPTIWLSDAPTRNPSAGPSDEPSTMPSSTLSDIPTRLPTDKPTDVPSTHPSIEPTNTPAAAPSSTPTTSQPSTGPSIFHSDIPTDSPSVIESDIPTIEHSGLPSTKPSEVSETSIPTSIRSFVPTNIPTEQPITESPSNIISTNLPSTESSNVPSNYPTTSVPSDLPTKYLSNRPSEHPSDKPTTKESDEPTTKPSDRPRSLQSDEPTTKPSDESTTKPSNEPTVVIITNKSSPFGSDGSTTFSSPATETTADDGVGNKQLVPPSSLPPIDPSRGTTNTTTTWPMLLLFSFVLLINL